MKGLLSVLDRGVSVGHYAAVLIAISPILAVAAFFRFVLNYELFDRWFFIIPASAWALLVAWRYIVFEISDYRYLMRRAAEEEGRKNG